MTIAQKASLQLQPDDNLVIHNRSGEIIARCSLWWTNTPPYQNHKLGLIGHYKANGKSAANALFDQACARLAANGCTMVVGPMDSNTWQRYRLVTGRGNEPKFFLEPDNPDDWPSHFLTNGFAPLAEYYSTLTTDLTVRDERIELIAEQMKTIGVALRSLQLDDFTTELKRIYSVSVRAFQNNFLYTPISQTEFLTQYEPLRSYVQPRLILLAEHEEQVIGFLFAVPNVLQAKIDTFIIKTVAVLPERQFAGLGSLLVSRSHEIAAAIGYKRAIHALMHESNKSRNISAHYSQPMRRYALFAKEL